MASLHDVIGVLLNAEAFERCFDIIILGHLLFTSKNSKIKEILDDRNKAIHEGLKPCIKVLDGGISFDLEWLGKHATVDRIIYLTKFEHELGPEFFSYLGDNQLPYDNELSKTGSLVLSYYLLRNHNYVSLETIPDWLSGTYNPLSEYNFGHITVPINDDLNITGSLLECLMATSDHEPVIYVLTKINNQILSGEGGQFYFAQSIEYLRNSLVHYIDMLEAQSDTESSAIESDKPSVEDREKTLAYVREVINNIDDYESSE